MDKPRLLFVVGTRPDAIKTAPVVVEAKKCKEIDVHLVSTGQHLEMLDQALKAFNLKVDINLALMKQGQSLAELTARALTGLDIVFREKKPTMVFAQGDTTSTFVAGLASFYAQIPFAHIEAGLRTNTIWNPFPEEFNRRAVADFAALHFPPTKWAAQNLFKEGIDPMKVFITGNTGIDAVLSIAGTHKKDWFPEHEGRVVLLTTHRRENWGKPQRDIACAAKQIVEKYPDVLLVVPLHKNPAVRETLKSVLDNSPRTEMIEPPDYADFVKLIQRSHIVLTDSGGVQEEAPSFGIPVLVLRETTERPEGVESGNAKLVGTDKDKIFTETCTLLDDNDAREKMAQTSSPYGDGHAAARIVSVALRSLNVKVDEVPMWG